MLLVMPVCGVDLHLARNVAQWIWELGGVEKHRALLVWDADVHEDDRKFIRELFKKSFMRVNEMEPKLPPDAVGWPDAPNVVFEFAVHYCCVAGPKYAEGGPWFFFEADQTPMRADWLDAMEEEYHKLGKPCLGVLEQSWKVPTPGTKVPAGKHLVGTAIYPAYFHTLTQRYRRCRKVAFDVWMQGDLVDKGHSAHTNLMLHCWLTEGYERQPDGSISCQKKEGRLAGQIGFSLDRTINAGSDVALVHGCKDGSLINLLRAERRAAMLAAAPEPIVIKPAEPEPVPVKPPKPEKPASTQHRRMKRRKPRVQPTT